MYSRHANITAILVAGAAMVSGCNVYDPELGAAPFKCNPVEPRCPDNYTCAETSPGVELCVSESQDPAALPDAAGDPNEFQCADDSALEVNNTPETATQTEVPTQPRSRLVGLAICPTTDVDVFAFMIPPQGADLTITLEVGSGEGELSLTLLGDNGTSVADGMPAPMDDSKILIELNQVPQGQYYAEVGGDGIGENNYNIEIEAAAN